MTETACPLPAVQEALAPYIHNRSETLRIRQQLDQYCFAQLEHKDEDAAHLIRAFSSDAASPKEISASISGVRRSYVKALQAHVAAKTRLEELRLELEELKHRTTGADDKQTDPKKVGSTEDYVALLSLRQRQRRLQVVRNYLGTLTNDANNIKLGLRDVVKREIGDHPEAPPPISVYANESTRSDELLLKLKKAVLMAKHDMDRAIEVNDTQGDATKSNLNAEVHALRRARDELVGWIEEQLAKVPEEPSMGENDYLALKTNDSTSQNVTFSDIEDRYKSYIASRESLIRFVESSNNTFATLLPPTSPTKRTLVSRHSPKLSALSPTNATRQFSNASKESSPTVTLLPYISALRDSSRTSQALLSQNAFLRRELAGAEDDRKATLNRLAQESHLLPGGAQAKVSAWSQAATNARKEMREFVEEKTSTGEMALARGVDALTDVETESRTVESLRGDA